MLDLFDQEKRPGINGVWSAEVKYDWANATYTELFVFEGEGEELHGTATFLKRKHLITKGSLKNGRLEFTTKQKKSPAVGITASQKKASIAIRVKS
ncbi:MAG: hypothetical protein ACK5M7_17185 [Draconibacterium sp.]